MVTNLIPNPENQNRQTGSGGIWKASLSQEIPREWGYLFCEREGDNYGS
jgi:hypothetical protein